MSFGFECIENMLPKRDRLGLASRHEGCTYK